MTTRGKTKKPRRRAIGGVKPAFQGLSPYRYADNPAENVFAKAWQKLNERRPGYPHGTLEYLMDPAGRGTPMPPLTERDHLVAATVIQWLGSPVGLQWLDETLKTANHQLKKIRGSM